MTLDRSNLLSCTVGDRDDEINPTKVVGHRLQIRRRGMKQRHYVDQVALADPIRPNENIQAAQFDGRIDKRKNVAEPYLLEEHWYTHSSDDSLVRAHYLKILNNRRSGS